jgi:hypothetical protein
METIRCSTSVKTSEVKKRFEGLSRSSTRTPHAVTPGSRNLLCCPTPAWPLTQLTVSPLPPTLTV